MTLVEVDKIWGTPNEAERTYSGDDKMMLWEYGDHWNRVSKLRGLYHYKAVKFKNGKLFYWKKEGDIKIKTHGREDIFKSHLDEGDTLSKGMNKTETYKLWGLPASLDVIGIGDLGITTRWHYQEDYHLSHFIVFKNNKVLRWGDY
jgi:hypothetical protein